MVEQVRKSSRHIVRELGLLGDELCLLETTTAERHLLIELETLLFPDIKTLADLLLLNKSTISRLISTLAKKGLVEYVSDTNDKRRRCLQLTFTGKQMTAQIKQQANMQVESALDALSNEEREAVVKGLICYAKGLKKARQKKEFSIEKIIPEDDLPLSQLILGVLQEFGCDRPGFAGDDPELKAMYATFSKKGSIYFVIKKGKIVVGGAGIAPLKLGGTGVAELQKMYVSKDARGLGLGSLLISTCLEAAKKLGYTSCYLETEQSMVKAQLLYARHGFKKIIQRKGETGHFGCTCFFEKKFSGD